MNYTTDFEDMVKLDKNISFSSKALAIKNLKEQVNKQTQ
jgi:hypothetical protein